MKLKIIKFLFFALLITKWLWFFLSINANAFCSLTKTDFSLLKGKTNWEKIQNQNVKEAIKKENLSKKLEAGDNCNPKDPNFANEPNAKGNAVTCIKGVPAICDHGKWTLLGPCNVPQQCFVLPLVNKQGVSTTCGKHTFNSTLPRSLRISISNHVFNYYR